MIRHIVFFSVPRGEDLAAVEAGLKLLATIPTVSRLEVSRNLRRDAWSGEVDLVVYGEFVDEAALTAYKAHPTYAESIRRVKPLRELRMAADILAG
jgi:quinol monooxygenase YgiN